MFKFIFRTIVIIIFVLFLLIGIAVWKGGAPFKWIGKKTVAVGIEIQKVGDYIDDIKRGNHRVKKKYEEIKDMVLPDKEEKMQKK